MMVRNMLFLMNEHIFNFSSMVGNGDSREIFF